MTREASPEPLVKDPIESGGRLGGVHDFGARIDIGLDRILANNSLAESVDRRACGDRDGGACGGNAS